MGVPSSWQLHCAGLLSGTEQPHKTQRSDRQRPDLDEKRPVTQPTSDGWWVLTKAEEEEGEHDVVRLAPGGQRSVGRCLDESDRGRVRTLKLWGSELEPGLPGAGAAR